MGRPNRGAVGVFVALAAMLGIVVTFAPKFAVVLIAPLAIYPVIRDARVRAVVVILGGLFALQSSEGLSSTKMGYLAGAFVAFLAALPSMKKLDVSLRHRVIAPLLVASGALVGVVILGTATAALNGTGPSASMRDAAPYLLLASAPVFAVDLAVNASRRFVVALLVLAGGISGVSFALEFLSRHALSGTPSSGRFALPSLMLDAALFSYATAMSILSRRGRIPWTIVAVIAAGIILASGTRSVLSFVFAPLAIIAFTTARRSNIGLTTRIVKLLPLLISAAVLGVALISAGNAVGLINEHGLTSRLAHLPEVIRKPATDQSYLARQAEAHTATETFKANPILGAGLGHLFIRTDTGVVQEVTSLDTPLLYPAKFGLIGLFAAALLAVMVLAALARSSPEADGAEIPWAAMVGYVGVIAAYTLLVDPLEDKGLGFGVILLLALMLMPGQQRAAGASRPRRAAAP
jgi:hypothetical protein